jgi:hypothetical protein
MNSADTVEEVFEALRQTLPALALAKLKFKAPDHLAKQGSVIWRGRILAAKPKCIFDSTWCFYEVGVGRYAVEAPLVANSGGVGLICFVDNSKCGSGEHSTTVGGMASRFASLHPSFVASRRGEKCQGVSTYYLTAPGKFPVKRAAEDLAILITATLPALEALSVAK